MKRNYTGNMSELEGKDKVKVLLAKALFRKSRCTSIRRAYKRS